MKQSGKDKTMSPVWTISKKYFVEEGNETMKNLTIFLYIPNELYIYCFLGSVFIYMLTKCRGFILILKHI